MTNPSKTEVYKLCLENHPYAEKLSIVHIDGYTCVTQTAEWQYNKLGAFIPPDSLVDVRRPEFSFLVKEGKFDENSNRVANGEYARIRARKIRGIVSYGLLIPAKPEWIERQDVTEELGIKHYQMPIPEEVKIKDRFMMGGEVDKGPYLCSPYYDVYSFQKYAKKVFKNGELVVVSEKIEGSNARYVYHNNKFHCGSRTEWKREYAKIPVPDKDKVVENVKDKNYWHDKYKSPEEYAELMERLQNHPDIIVYGELYGHIKNFHYDCKSGELKIAVFDLLRGSTWIDHEEARQLGDGLNWVPFLSEAMSYDFDKLLGMADGKSFIEGATNIKEGIVVKPLKERFDPSIGRVQLKIKSPTYLEKH